MIYTKNTSGLFFARPQRNIYFSFIFFLVMLFMPISLLAQVETGSFVFEGRTRDYLVFLPQNYYGTAKMPVVFHLHGAGGDNQMQLDYTQMNIVADTAGFIVVYPNGINRMWRVGSTIDVGFISALIDTLDRHYSIDLERIYACGFSSGGFMSCKLACQLSHKITAIATVAGGIVEEDANNNEVHRPMPVLSIHGTADPRVPYDTGRPDLNLWSAEQTVKFWADFNLCSELDTISIADLDTIDGCTVEKITYGNGTHNSRVLFYKIIGGGHTWPDAAFGLVGNGRTNKDINANTEIWNFFKDYKLSQLFFQHDLMVKSFPLSNLPILANNIQPIVEVKNYGWNNEFDITITCEIDSAGTNIYSESQIIDTLMSLEKTFVTFQNWRTFNEFIYDLKFQTRLTSDENNLNDTLSAKVIVSNLIDDFEAGMVKWQTDNRWVATRGSAHSGKFGLKSSEANYKNNVDSWIEYQYSFDLSGLNAAHISYWTKYYIQTDRDFGYIEASVDNGETWQQLGDRYTGTQSTWKEDAKSLTSFCGPGFTDVRIRFHFVSDSSGTSHGWYIDDINIYPYELGTSVSQAKGNQMPQDYILFDNYPNPFNAQTVIEYQIPEAGHVRVSIYNLLGQRIITLADKKHQAGRFNLIWDGKDYLGKSVPSGVYFCKMEAEGFTETKKMLLLE